MTESVTAAEVVLSADEVEALCRVLEVDLPEHLARLVAGLDPAARFSTAAHGLIARGLIVRQGTDAWSVPEPLVDMVTLLGAPGLFARVECEAAGELSVLSIYAAPDGSLLEELVEDRVFAYSPMATADLLPAILAATGLTEDNAPVASPATMTMTSRAMVLAGESVLLGEQATAVAALTDVGADPAVAAEFVAAVSADRRGSYGVSTVHRADDVLTATVTSWVDCGDQGRWLIDIGSTVEREILDSADPAELSTAVLDVRTEVQRVSAQDIIDRIVAGLPGG